MTPQKLHKHRAGIVCHCGSSLLSFPVSAFFSNQARLKILCKGNKCRCTISLRICFNSAAHCYILVKRDEKLITKCSYAFMDAIVIYSLLRSGTGMKDLSHLCYEQKPADKSAKNQGTAQCVKFLGLFWSHQELSFNCEKEFPSHRTCH